MGCAFSGHASDRNGRSFRVYNVDDQGMVLTRGRLEIRDSELVLYQKGKEPIRWPLRWLRRYGCDDELFSFESGRRCATGNGIFAFKCTHAETLFNLVHDSLERAGEDDHRAQHQLLPLQHQQSPLPTTTRNVTARQRAPESLPQISSLQSTQPHAMYTAVRSNSVDHALDDGSQNGSAHLYVNGPLGQDEHQYINTSAGPPRSVSAAMQMDETTALVNFLHNPPPGCQESRIMRDSPASASPVPPTETLSLIYAQMNYAVIELADGPASMENLLDESGQGAVHNLERRGLLPADGTNRLSQPAILGSGVRGETSRLSMPNDLTAAASQENDLGLQSADSDVFLDAAPEGQAPNANYVNLTSEDVAASAPAHGASGSIPPPLNLCLPPTHEVALNYANLTIQSPKQVNYIIIDHKSQANEPTASGVSGGGPLGGAGGHHHHHNTSNNSPISPTSCLSFPDSPSRKTRSYATIDFDRTQALSNTTRSAPDEEGSRKTRHNSSISDMPS